MRAILLTILLLVGAYVAYNYWTTTGGRSRSDRSTTVGTSGTIDAQKAREYGLIDAVVAGELPEPKPVVVEMKEMSGERAEPISVAAQESPQVPQSTGDPRQSTLDS